jgi:excisionase family DNA binding protein
MKTIDNTNYYDKEEAAALIGCTLNTLNRKISKARIVGYRFGRKLHYTEAQIKQIVEYRED